MFILFAVLRVDTIEITLVDKIFANILFTISVGVETETKDKILFIVLIKEEVDTEVTDNVLKKVSFLFLNKRRRLKLLFYHFTSNFIYIIPKSRWYNLSKNIYN